MPEKWMSTLTLHRDMGAHAESRTAERISTQVIEAIADARGVDPTELDVPLYWEIDLEALDRLCDASDVAVTFTYEGVTVTADADGRIAVDDAVYEA